VATFLRDFNAGLYQEHLEDASFLYGQRQAYLRDPEVNWADISAWEDRLEAHLDALMVGGDLALEVCRKRAAAGEPGEMHAALRVFCRQDRKESAFETLDVIDPADDAAVDAAVWALCSEAGWRDDILRAFQQGDDRPHLTRILARVAGYRRFSSEGLVAAKLSRQPSLGRPELAWALGRVGSAASVPLLRSLLEDSDLRVQEAAAIALMRLGDDLPVQHAARDAGSHAWARRVLAIGGNSKSVRALLDVLRVEPDADTIIALGLLGDLSAVAPLVDRLDDEAFAESAAVALNTITGAQLYARVFLEDTFDLDELSHEERATYEKDGTLPTRNGKPFGNWERRPLLDKAGWRAWLEDHKHAFSRQHRWRMGKPHGPAALLDCLTAEATPYSVRAATSEEFVVRFGMDVPFEVDLPVALQRRFLGKIENWVTSQSGRFDDGAWYFAGERQG
jgi:uncharacterized protein (TIGR02270 family)